MNAIIVGFGLPSQDLRLSIGGAFFGFTLGAMYVLSEVIYDRCLGSTALFDVTDYSESHYDKLINTTLLIQMIQCFESHWCVIILLFTVALLLKACFELLGCYRLVSSLMDYVRLREHGYPTARSIY